MARKNSKVRRANARGRLPRGDRGFSAPKQNNIPRVPVEDLVLPDGQCYFQNRRRPKAKFATEEKARKALAQAQVQRARMGSTHVEKRYYKCPEGGCGGYHLTSRDEYDTEAWKRRQGPTG